MRFLKHKYGHFIQEKDWGPLALISGIESAISNFMDADDPDKDLFNQNHDRSWMERDADYRGYHYFLNRDNKLQQSDLDNLIVSPRNFDDYYIMHSLLLFPLIIP